MENKKRKILIVEDDKIDRMAFERFANEEKLPYNYIFAESVKEAKKFLEKEIFDAVLLDYRLGDGTAFDLFDKVETFPFIIVTGTGDEEIAVKAMKSGAYDYLIKDAEGNYLKILPVTVENVIKRKLAELASKRTEEEILLKHKQLLSIFDSIDEVIYVADPTTYELLYFNEAFKSRWKVNVGDKCYKVLQNQTSPCSFCSNKYIFGENLGKTYIWEWQNLVDRHWYRCIDRAIKWPDGRMVRYEMAIDVTERKQTEEALQESERRYRKLVENASDVIYSLAEDGSFISLNPAFERITGWSCSEWLGKPFMPLIHPSDLPLAIESFKQSLGGKKQPPYELRVLSKSGEYLVGEFISTPLIEKDKVIGEFGIARDVTQRKRAEEALRQAEQKYRNIFENAVIGIHQSTLDGRFLMVNQTAARIHGYDSPEEMMAMVTDISRQTFVKPGRRAEFIRLVQEHGSVSNFEYQVYRKDGSVIWISANARGVYDANGKLVGFEGTSIDITERKQAEEKLRKSEERYRTLVENLTVGVYRNTADPHGRFVQANFAIAKMFGYDSADEFMRIKVSDMYQESEDRKLFVEAITQTGSVTNKELRLKKKDGTPIWASVSARAHYDEKGNIDWMDGVIEDITERKRAEEELQKRLRELELYYNITIGRESRIIELKHQVNELLERLGEKKKYKV